MIAVPEAHPIIELFNSFLHEHEHEHIAPVVDESGAAADMQLLARRSRERRAKRYGLSTQSATKGGAGPG